jgi:hypothetical protein
MARAASMRCHCQRQHRETKRDDDAHGNAVTTLCRFAWLALHLHYFFTVVIFLFFSRFCRIILLGAPSKRRR